MCIDEGDPKFKIHPLPKALTIAHSCKISYHNKKRKVSETAAVVMVKQSWKSKFYLNLHLAKIMTNKGFSFPIKLFRNPSFNDLSENSQEISNLHFTPLS